MTAVARAKPAVFDPAQQRRRALIARWHLLAKEKGLDEDTRRDRLQRSTGKRSAADCSVEELANAVAALSGQAAPIRRADTPHAKKARALWLSLWNLGVVRDPSERALEAMGRRQLGVDKLQWSDPETADRLIEALKAMAERAGWSQRVTRRREAPPETLQLKQALYRAQGERLGLGGFIPPGTEAQIDKLIAARGEQIRAAIHHTAGEG